MALIYSLYSSYVFKYFACSLVLCPIARHVYQNRNILCKCFIVICDVADIEYVCLIAGSWARVCDVVPCPVIGSNGSVEILRKMSE